MRRICLFARPVVPGEVKTRLIPGFGPDGAARLYAAMLRDCVDACRSTDTAVTPWIAGNPHHPSLAALPATRRQQPSGGLGRRLQVALQDALVDGGPVLCVGSDAPVLSTALLGAAFERLSAVDLVLSPAADGGFTLLGVRGPMLPDLRTGIRYSTSHACADTVAAARRAGLSVALLPPSYDVDTPADVRLLTLHCALDPTVARATAAVLSTAGFLTPAISPR